jgi:DNA-binding transcriptional MerR regulator
LPKKPSFSNLLKVNQVVELLKSEFEDLTPSKIRFLESRGLIKPKRSESGYRLFSEQDIETLRAVLRLQKERFLPLSVIKERLESPDSLSSLVTQIEEEAELEEEQGLNREKFKEITKLSDETLEEMLSYGLLMPEKTLEGEEFSSYDLRVAQTFLNLSAFGIEPRHLRMYVNFGEREKVFIEQMLLPYLKQKSSEGKRQAREKLQILLKNLNELRKAILIRSLEKYYSK